MCPASTPHFSKTQPATLFPTDSVTKQDICQDLTGPFERRLSLGLQTPRQPLAAKADDALRQLVSSGGGCPQNPTRATDSSAHCDRAETCLPADSRETACGIIALARKRPVAG